MAYQPPAQYDEDFKDYMVELVHTDQASFADLEKQFGIPHQQLSRWYRARHAVCAVRYSLVYEPGGPRVVRSGAGVA